MPARGQPIITGADSRYIKTRLQRITSIIHLRSDLTWRIPQNTLQRIEANGYYWLSANYKVDIYPDYILEQNPNLLKNKKVIVLPYHAPRIFLERNVR